MKTAFLTFEQFFGRKDIGSSRIRAKWVVEKWREAGPDIGEAEIYKFGGKYDVIVFQKAYWHEYANDFTGIKILDLCDPDFLHWGYPIKQMIEACDAVTCSSEALAEAVTEFAGEKPVWVIPDRIIDPDKFKQKIHVGDTKSVSWFGYAENFPMLESAIGAIKKFGLELIVVSSKPFVAGVSSAGLKITNFPWSSMTWEDDIRRADVVINPRGGNGRWKYKSNNKTTQSWALGMPVAHDQKELSELLTEKQRNDEVLRRRKEVLEDYDVKSSVEEYKNLILEIQNGKKAS